jgi:hypothetical protein
MLPHATRTGRCIVALWQFIAFTVLIGALLVNAWVIARRLGGANTRLSRIEQAVLAKTTSIHSADSQADAAKPEVSGGQESGGGYLTIHDLRQLSSRATRSGNRNSIAVSERRDALKTTRGLVRSPGATSERGGSVAIGSESSEALKARGEQSSSHDTRPLTVDSAPTSLESGDAPATNSGEQSPPGDRPPSDDSVAEKNRDRDMTLFLSNQRRRRRARLGY